MAELGPARDPPRRLAAEGFRRGDGERGLEPEVQGQRRRRRRALPAGDAERRHLDPRVVARRRELDQPQLHPRPDGHQGRAGGRQLRRGRRLHRKGRLLREHREADRGRGRHIVPVNARRSPATTRSLPTRAPRWRSRSRRCWRTTAISNGDALNLAGFTQPAHGTLTRAGGVLTYRPDAGYVGPDSFGYTVSDGSLSDTGTVTIAVGNPIDVWYGLEQTFGSPGEAQLSLDQHPRQRRGPGHQARVLAERRGDAEALDRRRRAPLGGRRRLQRR